MLKDVTMKLRQWWPQTQSAQTTPAAADSPHQTILTHLKNQDWQTVIDICQRLIVQDPNAWYYHSLGQAFVGQGNQEAAIQAFQTAIDRDPNLSWSHYELGRCLIQQGDDQAAIAALQQSIKLNPDFSWAYHSLGELWLDQDQAEPAIEAYRKAAQLDPQEPFFQEKLAYATHLQTQAPMTVEMLLKHPPKLHQVFGRLGSLGISDDVIQFLNQQVQPGDHTLETGAGLSTLLFAIKGANHHCVVPDPELVDRIQAYCQRHQISTKNLTFHVERSEDILPHLQLEPLDLVLIDGRHAFPSPFIDWYYTTNWLKVGGLSIVDDIQLWTGEVLRQFLKLEPEWELVTEVPVDSPNSSIFRKLQEGSHDKWWLQQPYAVQQCPQSMMRVPPSFRATNHN